MEVRLLGSLEVVGDDGVELPVSGAKTRALLAMLALEAGHVVASDRLIEVLWRDGSAPVDVVNSLQRLVSKLRKSLGGDLVAMRPPGYVLAVRPDDVDVHRVDQLTKVVRAAIERGDLETVVETCVRAESLWRGVALAEFAYDEFAQPHIARLEETRLSLIEERVDAELRLGRHQGLIADLEVLVAERPLRERLRGQLMLALYRDGRQADALRVFQDGRTILAEELGLDPGVELRQLEMAILNHDPSLGSMSATVNGPRSPRSNLRRSLTALFGRDDALGELTDLSAGHRLITLVGPGGAGKTRLATELARRAFGTGRRDVVMVELAAVGEPAAVPAAIAAAFELRDPEIDSLVRVREVVASRDQPLMVVDNCEHLVAAAADAVAALLEGCETLAVVTTSREALRVPGEVVWVVPPLPSSAGVALFVDRATAADPRFVVEPTTLETIGQICARLDGLPLAIELAAARTRAFTVAQIAARLDDRFRLLSGGSRTAMARQQTLRAVVDWSYDLLFDDERRVFERLSVFPDGFTVGAAEAVCTVDGLDPADVADHVAGLVDKSLLVTDRSGSEARYTTLQTLRHYGRERLVERGDADDAFGRMTVYFAEICAGGRAAWRGTAQREWFETVGTELDGIRTGFEWAVGAGEKERAVGIAADLAFGRWIGGGTAEGLRWLETAMALPGDVSPFIDGWSRFWRAFLAFVRGQRDRNDEQFDEAIALLHDQADPMFEGYALTFYAQLVDATGRRTKATMLNHRVLDVLSTTTDPWAQAAASWTRAALAIQESGDFDAFASGLRDAKDRFRAVGDQFMTAICLDLAAEMAEFCGDLDTALDALTEALAIVDGWRMKSFEAGLLARSARGAVQRADFDAEQLVELAVLRADDLVFLPGRAIALNALATLHRRAGRLDDAELAATAALRFYRDAPALRFASSFSRAPTPFDIPVGAATSLSVLGFVAEARGDARQAIVHHRAAFDEVATFPHPRMMALCLEGLASAVVLAGQFEVAARLLGAGGQLREAFGAAATPVEQADIDRTVRAVTSALDHDAYRAAARTGAHTPPAQLVADV